MSRSTGSGQHILPITLTVTVPLGPAAAFSLFADGLGGWWPREYTWGQEVLEWIGIEPGEGGRCTERGPGGFECDWGQVRSWEPPTRLELSWQISPRREPVPDPAQASRVTVGFAAEGGGTAVTLTHGEFERHGDGAAEYRDALASREGWPFILGRYVAAAGK